MIDERKDCKQNVQATQIPRDAHTSGILFSSEEWASLAYEFKLSSRELQIVQGILDNQTERQTALQLGISHHTIHTHLCRVYRKLNVGNRSELIISIFTEFRRQQKSLKNKLDKPYVTVRLP